MTDVATRLRRWLSSLPAVRAESAELATKDDSALSAHSAPDTGLVDTASDTDGDQGVPPDRERRYTLHSRARVPDCEQRPGWRLPARVKSRDRRICVPQPQYQPFIHH